MVRAPLSRSQFRLIILAPPSAASTSTEDETFLQIQEQIADLVRRNNVQDNIIKQLKDDAKQLKERVETLEEENHVLRGAIDSVSALA
jgi:septal ring factor EnvC (AmiA/AmiB activator)